MRDLLNLLNKFRNSLDKDTLTKTTIQEIIKETTKVNIPKENIFIKKGVLEISTGATAKNELLLKDEQIKEMFKSHGLDISRILYK